MVILSHGDSGPSVIIIVIILFCLEQAVGEFVDHKPHTILLVVACLVFVDGC